MASTQPDGARVYDTVLATLGVERTSSGDTYTEWGEFSLAGADKTTAMRIVLGVLAQDADEVRWEGRTWRAA